MGALRQMVGVKCGRLTGLKRVGVASDGKATWLFRCDCGNEVVVSGKDVSSGHTKSCGCLQRETVSRLSFKHGDTRHGKINRLFRVWQGMVSRCKYPSRKDYMHYGGRGITVCAAWYDYQTFKAWAYQNGYSDHLEIDRVNNDGNYEPGNCTFVTHAANLQHTSRTINSRSAGQCMNDKALRMR